MSVNKLIRARLCFVLLTLAATTSAQAAPGDFLGSSFLLNSDSFGYQDSDLASDAAGRVLAIGEPLNGSTAQIVGRRYAADGTALGSTLVLAPVDGRVVRFGPQALAMAPDGRFVIVYTGSLDAGRQSRSAVYVQRFNADGTRIGAEIRVSEILSMPQAGDPAVAGEPAVGISSSGDFVVAWTGFSDLGFGGPFSPLAAEGTESRIYMQRFSADGRKRGINEVLARGYNYQLVVSHNNLVLGRTGRLTNARIAVEADGDFVVAWNRTRPAPSDFPYDIELRTYTAAGTARAPLRTIVQSSVATPLQDLAALTDGFVAAWNLGGSARLQRFAADGSVAGTEFAFPGAAAGAAALAVASNDATLWSVTLDDGMGAPDVAAQLYDATGSAAGSPFTVPELSVGTQDRPRMAADGDGNFVIGWRSDAPGPGLPELRARRIEGF